MDYKTAHDFLIDQGTALETRNSSDAFLVHLEQGQPPIPGQVTSILLALKIADDVLKKQPTIERELVLALYLLAMESHQKFEVGKNKGVQWPPLLREDLRRIATGVKSILAGQSFETGIS
ncbi:MAG: Dethiobiotin synthetase [Microcoleaceae cyanobacterium]